MEFEDPLKAFAAATSDNRHQKENMKPSNIT